MRSTTAYAPPRFLSAVALSAGGALITVGAFTFSPSTERWTGFGIAAGLLALLLVCIMVPGRGTAQRGLDLVIFPVCAWTLVSSRTLELAINGAGPHLVKWIGFSSGAAICGLGILSLLLHEMSLERDLQWATEELVSRHRSELVDIPDYRGTTIERDSDALSRTTG